MIAFEVNDMSCGHCVSTITNAVRAVDKNAKVQVDLASHRVQIEPTEADTGELGDAIREAGYTPVQIDMAPDAAAAVGAPPKRGGCCCG